jgi:collagenase-like PrtC family protease
VQAERRDCVGRGKLPSREDRLHDFETVRNPVDARQQCFFVHAGSWRDPNLEDDLRLYAWLSETHERKGFADLGDVVYRAIGESYLSSHGHLAARLAHLSYYSGYAVSIVKVEGRKARRERRDLAASIEGG